MILTLEKFQKLNFSEQFQKIGKSWYGDIKPIFGQMGKLKLSVSFRRPVGAHQMLKSPP